MNDYNYVTLHKRHAITRLS